MNKGVWKGNNIVENRILILGESHHEVGTDDIGKPVPYETSGVVQLYISDAKEKGGSLPKWHEFFKRIAESFGYNHDSSDLFYEKVWFGNYCDIICGVAENNSAKVFIKEHSEKYNDELFSFVNENRIGTIICFSKLVYKYLPKLLSFENRNSIAVGRIGKRRNIVDICEYKDHVQHSGCNVMLEHPITVYAIRHPLGKGGYNVEQIHQYLSSKKELSSICL